MHIIIHKKLLITFLFLISILVLSGCTEKECEVDSDCRSKVCQTVTCTADNTCDYVPIQDCCGNRIKEDIENGKPGNSCTCPADYGKCEGKPELTKGSRTYEAQYVEQFCNERNECVTGVPDEKIKPISLLDERDFSFFKLETTANYNNPFDVAQDTMSFRFSILDDHEDLVWPVRITKIVVKDGELIMGEKTITTTLGGVGDSSVVNIPIIYTLDQAEETRSLTFKINYEYTKRVKIGKAENGSIIYENKLERKDYQKKFSTKLNLFDSR